MLFFASTDGGDVFSPLPVCLAVWAVRTLAFPSFLCWLDVGLVLAGFCLAGVFALIAEVLVSLVLERRVAVASDIV